MLQPRRCSFSLVVASLFRFISLGDDHEHNIAGCGEQDCFLSI